MVNFLHENWYNLIRLVNELVCLNEIELLFTGRAIAKWDRLGFVANNCATTS